MAVGKVKMGKVGQLISRIIAFGRSVFILDRASHPGNVWWWVHIVLCVVSVGIMAWGIVLPRSAMQSDAGELFQAGATLWLSAAISLLVSVRLASLLFGFPVSRSALSRSVLITRPWLFLPLAVLFHVSTALSPYPLLILHGGFAPWTVRVAVVVALALCALPLWLVLVAPRRYFRESRSLRPRPQWAKIATWGRRLLEPLRDLVWALQEIRRGLANRAAKKGRRV